MIWARTYPIGRYGGAITNIKQTTDGGYVAAGNSYASGSTASGGLILKLDGSGTLQWERTIGPAGSTTATFNAVQQTTDGGYVATGSYYAPAQGALVVKLDSSGNTQWQHGFSNTGTSGIRPGPRWWSIRRRRMGGTPHWSAPRQGLTSS